jgi:ketosteroid isomerase-like protein
MDNLQQNKALALRWVEAVVAGDTEATRSLFAPDCSILIAGDMPYCGRMDVDAFFRQAMVLPLAGPIIFEVGDIVAEGDRVWFEAQSQARLTNGQDYRNAYIFQMKIRDGAIVDYKEFTDTLHVWRLIDDPSVRGAPTPRQPFLTNIAHRFQGGGISEAQRGT